MRRQEGGGRDEPGSKNVVVCWKACPVGPVRGLWRWMPRAGVDENLLVVVAETVAAAAFPSFSYSLFPTLDTGTRSCHVHSESVPELNK